MSEMLSPLDVVNKGFKKVMRGYDTAEVDDFLDLVAESLQDYATKCKELEEKADDQAIKLEEYDRIKGSIHEALLMAQRTADEKIANAARSAEMKINDASARAEDIVAEARIRAERIVADAENKAASIGAELERLSQLRAEGLSYIRTIADELHATVEKAEREGRIEIPSFTVGVTHRRESAPVLVDHQHAVFYAPASETHAEAEGAPEPKADLSETLSALGIDPGLLDTEVR